MEDCLIIGGGVVGLSLAYELAGRSVKVQLLDRQLPGKEASWAGAGILPPASRHSATDPADQLRALSAELHPVWAGKLRAETGIDTGYRSCGGIYLARSIGEAASLQGMAGMFSDVGIEIHSLSPSELQELEPSLSDLAASTKLRAAYFAPGESQLRNPHHIQALIMACRQRGVEIHANVTAGHFEVERNRVRNVVTSSGVFRAENYCITSGAWTYDILRRLGIETGILPVRGQMVLYRNDGPPFSRVLNEGARYLVPRDDGRVLVGSGWLDRGRSGFRQVHDRGSIGGTARTG
jgi:glycine oxidase